MTPHLTVRRLAADELASSDDDRAFDAVVRFVRERGEGEEDDKSASDVLRTLARHHGERALPLLREIAFGEITYLSIAAFSALGRLGLAAVPTLLELGRDPRPERRHTAIDGLKSAYRHSPDPRIVEFLFEVIQENPTLCIVAERMRYHAALAPSRNVAIHELSSHCWNIYRMPRSLARCDIQRSGRWVNLEMSGRWTALTAIYEETQAWERHFELDIGNSQGDDMSLRRFRMLCWRPWRKFVHASARREPTQIPLERRLRRNAAWEGM